MKKEELVKKAADAMKNAYAPYSDFCVGAALLSKNGNVYTGCNVENASYSVTNCAERTALFYAVSQGEREFDAIAVVGGYKAKIKQNCPPCGVCRQAMAQFAADDFKIYLYDGKEISTYTLGEMLPMGFGLN